MILVRVYHKHIASRLQLRNTLDIDDFLRIPVASIWPIVVTG